MGHQNNLFKTIPKSGLISFQDPLQNCCPSATKHHIQRLFLAMLESVGGLEGLGDDKDDKSEVSDKARGEEVGF